MPFTSFKPLLPWSLRGVTPLLNKYGDGVFFRSVTRTRPIEVNPHADTGIHSAVPHRYVLAYVTALKSLLRFHRDVAVYVHDDGSLRKDDKALIRTHLPGAEIVDRTRADETFSRQVGDEFLVKVRGSYTSYLKLFDPTLMSTRRRIVIVDTDVLFMNRPDVVIDWIRSGGVPWYHRSEPWLKKKDHAPRPAASAPALPSPQPMQPTHIQKLVVQRVGEINEKLGSSYAFIPGFNSGLIGYEHGTVQFAELRILLKLLFDMFGDRIFRWGAEQTMHGLILCGRGATALPSEQYMVFTDLNSDRAAQATFVHFIGEFRYHRFVYPWLAGQVIRELQRLD